jgi:tetratricopeptide (TPR) repeat protein/predicted aspartyl protease
MSHLGCLAAVTAFFASTAIAAGSCQLQQLGTMPVDMPGGIPLVWTRINGAKARFLVDTGQFYSTIARDAASQYHLDVDTPMNGSFSLVGAGGSEKAYVTTVAKFEFLGMPLSKIQFLVINGGAGGNLAGRIGQNLLRISDVEFDLANGAVRFFKPVGCNDHPLAYWAVSTPYSFVKLESMNVQASQLRSDVMINGHRMTTWFVTGISRSMLSLDAAERAGIRPDSPGVKFLGVNTIDGRPLKEWAAPIAVFQIGDEKVMNTHLLITEYDPAASEAFPDLMLGSDFFLSHRVYVAYSQRKLYFTYNGGPLFNLNLPGYATAVATPAPNSGATSQENATTGQQSSGEPTDAAGFRRRGMAFAAMREFDRALADLTSACELAPHDAENLYQRGVIYDREGRFKSALQDFNAAITAQPDDVDAHMARAELLQSHPDADPAAAAGQVKSDFDAVSRLATPAADVRLRLSSDYGELGDYSAAITQVDQWLDNHRPLNEQAIGLNERCWLRASANRDLQAALDDCNRALTIRPYGADETGSLIRRARGPQNPGYLDSRGLVYLRLGDLKNAVHDYDTALQIDPKIATSLYGRGLAELREGQKTQGEADLAAGEKVYGGVGKIFANMGLAP